MRLKPGDKRNPLELEKALKAKYLGKHGKPPTRGPAPRPGRRNDDPSKGPTPRPGGVVTGPHRTGDEKGGRTPDRIAEAKAQRDKELKAQQAQKDRDKALKQQQALSTPRRRAAVGGTVRSGSGFAPKRPPVYGEKELERSKAKLKVLKKTGKMPTGVKLPRDPNRY